jgi:ABC-2 type transport system permease protein
VRAVRGTAHRSSAETSGITRCRARLEREGKRKKRFARRRAPAAQVIAGYSQEASGAAQRARMVGGTMNAGGAIYLPMPQIVSRPRVWYNPDLKSRNYFIPGVVVNIITIVTLSLTAMAIAREKEIGTMEQLMVTPIRPVELILGKTLPFVLVGYWDLILVTGAAMLIFHVPFNGRFLLLMFAAFVFLLTTLGAGLFISTISRTQQQAMMATTLRTSC